MSRGILRNPIVQIALALVVILVIATLSFASAISGALTAENQRNNLYSLNCNYGGRLTRSSRTCLGVKEDGWLNPIGHSRLNSSIILMKFR